ncbi:DUF6233 domain-containing protein [Streptomyces sp900116325]|uniref:DUF6233 domain-containing protein n=1 Tax=Streptomyces sp. 900116325 TaxID=3154295 RepID=UPI0033B48A1D
MRFHQPTIDYVARRTAEGKTKREIIRCLKRYVIREVYHLIRPAPQRVDNYRSVNAHMESTIGQLKTELIKPGLPCKTLPRVVRATAERIDWYCHRRLRGEIGHIPPVEYETNKYLATQPRSPRSQPQSEISTEPGAVRPLTGSHNTPTSPTRRPHAYTGPTWERHSCAGADSRIRELEIQEQQEQRRQERARAEQSWKIEPKRTGDTAMLHRGGCTLCADMGFINREEAIIVLAEPHIEACQVCTPQTGLT